MRFLLFLRDRVLPYLFLLCIVIGGIGSIGWIFAQTYFWQTSDVTFMVDKEISSVKIDIQARIIYKDFMIFGNLYPLHITLPSNRVISCSGECIFSDIPAGDIQVELYTQAGLQRSEKIVIAPDTKGNIDMRLPIRLNKVTGQVAVGGFSNSINADIDPESVFYQNPLQGLGLFYDKGLLFLYDTSTQQSVLLGNNFKIRSVIRGIQDGTYYLLTEQNEVLIFDRYGRQKTEKITHSVLDGKDIIWESRDENITSKLIINDQERVFSGRLFWFSSLDNRYLFDGENIFEIING